MCLGLKGSIWGSAAEEYKLEDFKQTTLHGQEMFVGYKVITDKLRSPFQSAYVWKEGLNCSGRPFTELLESEEKANRVDVGFHVIASLSDAVRMRDNLTGGLYSLFSRTSSKSHRIIKVYVKPEDVVAVGFFKGDYTEYELNMVCTKCWVEDLEEIDAELHTA
jgi:hypothetical protein